MNKEEFEEKLREICKEYKIKTDYNIGKISTYAGVDINILSTLYTEFNKMPDYNELINKIADLSEENKQLKERIQKVLDILKYNFDPWLEPQDTMKIQKCVKILEGSDN